MNRTHCIAALGLTLAAGAIEAGAELRLEDGQVLRGTEVHRDGNMYLLHPEAGGVLVIPVELVSEVRLIADDPPPERTAPSGFRSSGSETLAGGPVEPPETSRQLGVFREPAHFAGTIIDPEWRPQSDWDMDPVENNNFAPSQWSKGVVDPEWRPTSAFDANKDVMERSKSTFSKSVLDNTWQPQDGFKKDPL